MRNFSKFCFNQKDIKELLLASITNPAISRSRLAFAAEISEIPDDNGHTVKARTYAYSFPGYDVG